jgi:septal ring factor EnvC (AmiA/AmiB activator)
MLNRLSFIISVLFLFMSNGEVYSQFLNQKDLEKKRIELTKEINNIQNLINSSKSEKKLVIENIENLNYKLDLQNEVIKIINNELNIISNSIQNNESKSSQLLKTQKLLKSQYAEMILRSYKTRSKTGKLMFIFSSSNFQQAVKRIQYFKQYSDYQASQLKKIKKNSAELKTLNNQLQEERNSQEVLISNNQKIKSNINTQILDKNSLLQSISSNQKKYVREITSNQKKTAEIDKQIQRIIALAIAESNKKKNTSSKVFELTPEAKILSKNFMSNKGKLPWPVEQGYVTLRYGKQPHPVVKTATIQSNGIRIITSSSQKVRSIFTGVVYRIISSKNGAKTILIQHGNFFTVYKNLSNIYVKKGDIISVKQNLGEIITNKNSGQTILSFSLFKDNKTQNPLLWLGKK